MILIIWISWSLKYLIQYHPLNIVFGLTQNQNNRQKMLWLSVAFLTPLSLTYGKNRFLTNRPHNSSFTAVYYVVFTFRKGYKEKSWKKLEWSVNLWHFYPLKLQGDNGSGSLTLAIYQVCLVNVFISEQLSNQIHSFLWATINFYCTCSYPAELVHSHWLPIIIWRGLFTARRHILWSRSLPGSWVPGFLGSWVPGFVRACMKNLVNRF